MKTLEELEELTVDQLKEIANDLGAEPKANIRKPELVQLVYDIQQPEAPQDGDEDGTPEEVQDKPITTQEEFDGKLQEIVDHFNGTEAIEDGENEDGVAIYKIVDEMTDEVVAEGTFLELYDEVRNPHDTEEPPVFDEDESPEPDTPLLEEQVLETPALESDENFEKILEGIKPLQNLGLKYKVDGSVIKFQVGSKHVTTTLNQPPHRVVRTAEQLANFR